MVKRLAVLSFCALAAATPARAQTGTYVTGGWTEAYRESEPRLQSSTDSVDKSLVPGVSGAVGVWFTDRLAVEGGVTFLKSQSFPWYFTYILAGGTTSEVATHRDVPIVAAVRLAAIRSAKVQLEIVGGAGFTVHTAHSTTVARCGSIFQLPCTPISPIEGDATSSTEPTVMAGVDAPVRVSRRVAVVPSFRVFVINRRQWLTGYLHRGPSGGDGVVTTFGAGVRFGGGR